MKNQSHGSLVQANHRFIDDPLCCASSGVASTHRVVQHSGELPARLLPGRPEIGEGCRRPAGIWPPVFLIVDDDVVEGWNVEAGTGPEALRKSVPGGTRWLHNSTLGKYSSRCDTACYKTYNSKLSRKLEGLYC